MLGGCLPEGCACQMLAAEAGREAEVLLSSPRLEVVGVDCTVKLLNRRPWRFLARVSRSQAPRARLQGPIASRTSPADRRLARVQGAVASPLAPRVQGPGTRVRPGDATKARGSGGGRLRAAAYGGGRRGTAPPATAREERNFDLRFEGPSWRRISTAWGFS
jgi:hypothetical protein